MRGTNEKVGGYYLKSKQHLGSILLEVVEEC